MSSKTDAKKKKSAKKIAQKPVKKAAKKPAAITKMPTEKQLGKMKQDDKGYVAALEDAVEFLATRRQAAFNIARHYHLDTEELFQEGYEILLTCLRDYTPVYERADGTFVKVLFTTFFGNRMESRAMEMRNGNPEYQARQAFTEKMDDGERERFRSDPPLLVQHLDQENPMQEHLTGEASFAKAGNSSDVALKIARDSFFEKTLNQLVAKEKDEKKRAALLHVKVGGVYNFQEIAYYFGVTDSRASQVLNELMDAFYVQRIIDGDIMSVVRDFERMKFNEKRAVRLLSEALENSPEERQKLIMDTFSKMYESLEAAFKNTQKTPAQEESAPAEVKKERVKTGLVKPKSCEEFFTEEENEDFPLVAVEIRSIDKLKFTGVDFHAPESIDIFNSVADVFLKDEPLYPAIINEEGVVIDGERRIRLAQENGRSEYMCIVRRVPDELDCKILRVELNLRAFKPNKVDLYYAIGALADLGLSQQKIADAIGTSRTNVLVYAKVRDKASPKMRALFEDGLVQVTNASTCTELSDDLQDEVAAFIRRYGPAWSKGAKFNDLHLAAVNNSIDKLAAKHSPKEVVQSSNSSSKTTVSPENSSKAVQALQKRLDDYEQQMKDAEIWNQRRESVINSQNEALEEAKGEVEDLRKQLDAAELMKFGSPQVVEEELKRLRLFHGMTERLSSATHALKSASKDIRKLDLQRSQILETTQLMEETEKALNSFRVELLNKKGGS